MEKRQQAAAFRRLGFEAYVCVICEPEILDQAAKLKSRGGLSVAVSWIAATAIAHGATLIHKDPELRRLTEIPQKSLES